MSVPGQSAATTIQEFAAEDKELLAGLFTFTFNRVYTSFCRACNQRVPASDFLDSDDPGRGKQSAEGAEDVQNMHGQRDRSRFSAVRPPDKLHSVRARPHRLPRLPQDHQGNRQNISFVKPSPPSARYPPHGLSHGLIPFIRPFAATLIESRIWLFGS